MTIDYQAGLPSRMRELPVDAAGHPVPWFVARINGEYDFRVMEPRKIVAAIREHLCWVCGQEMGNARGTFVIGPMCAVNRVSAEPPSHHDCGVYSATHCPWLSSPRRKRRGKDMPKTGVSAGIMIERNPGVTLLWTSKKWQARVDPMGNGVLFDIGEPVQVRWYREGRRATLPEVVESIESGLPTVREAAEAQGEEAIAMYERGVVRAMEIVRTTVSA